MPELPEVESYTRYFARHALDQRIARVDVRDERILSDIRKETFARKLKGRVFTSVRRHGKHLFADAGAAWLQSSFRDDGRSRVLP
jgi:formamidopyrimidine-DNA glycosylase